MVDRVEALINEVKEALNKPDVREVTDETKLLIEMYKAALDTKVREFSRIERELKLYAQGEQYLELFLKVVYETGPTPLTLDEFLTAAFTISRMADEAVVRFKAIDAQKN